MSDYWVKRMAAAQKQYTNRTLTEVEKQLAAYYTKARKRVVDDFVNTYEKVLTTIEDGKAPTPADLYKLDSYWKMETQLKKELQKLGDKEVSLLSTAFRKEYKDIYKALATKGDAAYSTIDAEAAKRVAQEIWCADGKNWSSRIWNNTDKLQQKLNDGLIDCVVSGKKPSELKKLLINEFNVGYNRANTIVETELAHIETQAAIDRYVSHGRKQVRIVVDADERTCPICAALDDTIVDINLAQVGSTIPPFHPRCRCCVAPVVEAD